MKKILLLFSLFSFIVFSSCNKEGVDKDDYDKKEEKDWGDKKEKEKEACFKLVYPVTYTMPDGSELTMNGEKEDESLIKAWYESNPDSEEKPVLKYPVEIVYFDWDKDEEKEEKTIIVANEEEMVLAKENCYKEDDGE